MKCMNFAGFLVVVVAMFFIGNAVGKNSGHEAGLREGKDFAARHNQVIAPDGGEVVTIEGFLYQDVDTKGSPWVLQHWRLPIFYRFTNPEMIEKDQFVKPNKKNEKVFAAKIRGERQIPDHPPAPGGEARVKILELQASTYYQPWPLRDK